jgi:hypothetical protein
MTSFRGRRKRVSNRRIADALEESNRALPELKNQKNPGQQDLENQHLN